VGKNRKQTGQQVRHEKATDAPNRRKKSQGRWVQKAKPEEKQGKNGVQQAGAK